MADLCGGLPEGYGTAEEFFAATRKDMDENRRGIHRYSGGYSMCGADPWNPGVSDGRDRGAFTYAFWKTRNPEALEEDMRGTLYLRFTKKDFDKFRGELSSLTLPQDFSTMRVITQKLDRDNGSFITGGSSLFRGVENINRLYPKFGITFDYDGIEQVKEDEVNINVGRIKTHQFSKAQVLFVRALRGW